jgi:hypothetical protein
MGIYIQTPTSSKRDWLASNGERISGPVMIGSRGGDTHRYVFWQRAPWGENAALAYDRDEFVRLANSGVFEEVYKIPVESLKAIGIRQVTLGAWK